VFMNDLKINLKLSGSNSMLLSLEDRMEQNKSSSKHSTEMQNDSLQIPIKTCRKFYKILCFQYFNINFMLPNTVFYSSILVLFCFHLIQCGMSLEHHI